MQLEVTNYRHHQFKLSPDLQVLAAVERFLPEGEAPRSHADYVLTFVEVMSGRSAQVPLGSRGLDCTITLLAC